MASELIQQGDQYIGSHEKADNGYGQNGFQGSSSTRPGESVSSNFLPETRADAAALDEARGRDR